MKRTLTVSLAAGAVLAWVWCAFAATPAQPIPQNPSDVAAVPAFVGQAAVPHPVRSFRSPQHPFMASNGRSNIHDDAYQTNNYLGGGPLGPNIEVRSTYQNADCGTLVFDSIGRLISVCVGVQAPTLMMFDPATLDTLAMMALPPRNPSGGNPFSDFTGGGYFYLDQLDRAVIPTNDRQIWVVEETASGSGPGFALVRTYDLSSAVAATDGIVSALPDWSGRIWFVTAKGVVGVIEPTSGNVTAITLAGEVIANSFAVDEKGGVYIVSDHALYRFGADATGAPVVVWREVYDRGTRQKPGQVSQGSGTTPALVKSRYVAITDNSDPRMHVLVFRRKPRTRRPRLACGEAVFADGLSDTENSLIAVGTSLIAENNYGYSGPASTERGATTQPGITRVMMDGSLGCHTVWENQERAPSTVPKASLANGLVYAYTKDPGPGSVDAWYFTAIDFATGQTVFKRLAGTGLGYNNNYGPVTLGPDGAAYVGVLGGLVQLRDTPTP